METIVDPSNILTEEMLEEEKNLETQGMIEEEERKLKAQKVHEIFFVLNYISCFREKKKNLDQFHIY